MPKFFLKHLLIYAVVLAALIYGAVYSHQHQLSLVIFWGCIAAASVWFVIYPLIVIWRLIVNISAFIKNVRQRLRSGELVTSADYYEVVEFCAATAGSQAWIPKSLTKWALRKFLKKSIQEAIQKKFGNRLDIRIPPTVPQPLPRAAQKPAS